MLNPYIISPTHTPKKASMTSDEEQISQQQDHLADLPILRNWIWRLGNLLIRIGTRLTKENSMMTSANRNA